MAEHLARSATVVVAEPDQITRDLLVGFTEAAGHHGVGLAVSDPPEIVEATVTSTANVLVLDTARTTLDELDAVIDALAQRRYPIKVLALTDGPASVARAVATGADAALARPFHRRDFDAAIAALSRDEKRPTSVKADDEPGGSPKSTTDTVPLTSDGSELGQPVAGPASGLGDSFTDILKMGRQV